MAVIRVKSTHPPTQGDHVLMDSENFDPEVHELFEPTEEELAAVAEKLPEATAKGGKKRG